MWLLLAIPCLLISLAIRWFLNRPRPWRKRAKPYRIEKGALENSYIVRVGSSTVKQPSETPVLYTIGSSTLICWQQEDADVAFATLQEILTAHHLTMRKASKQEAKQSYFSSAGGKWQTLLLPINSDLGDMICSDLSRQSNRPVIAFMEYEQECWGYALFEEGKMRSYFWNSPQNFDVDPSACRGDAVLLAQLFQIDVEQLTPYLRHVDAETTSPAAKAFPHDEFPLADHWVRVDFMRRLGIVYPDPGDGKGRRIFIAEPGVNSEA